MKFNNQEYNIKVWNGEKLGKYIACDTETTMVPFHMTPELVTIQVFDGGTDVFYIPVDRIRLFFNKHYDSMFIFHNFSFDLDVISKALDNKAFAYDLIDRGNVRDTSILYRLYHLATIGYVPFKYSLKLLTEKYLGQIIEKDERRENFSQFLGSKISNIPSNYLEYGAIDVIATYFLHQELIARIQTVDKYSTLLSHDIQIKGEFALQRVYKNGIGFDLSMRDEWLLSMDKQLEIEADRLAMWGWVRGQSGIKDKYVQIVEMLGIKDKLPYKYDKEEYERIAKDTWVKKKDGRPLPEGKSVSLSSSTEDLEPFRDLDFVDAYINFHEIEKATSFVRDITSSHIHPRYTSLLNTGRTSCSKPNIQQMPRVGGVREMFVPTSKANVFVDIDYSSLELAVLSQVNITENGFSRMGDLINEGKCLHYHTACSVYNKKVENVTKDERQFAKIPNFGFGANMAPATFIDYCKGYGVSITEDRAKQVKEAWLNTYPEMHKFFNIGDTKDVFTLTGRKRANCSYTAHLNTKFQGLAADGFKLAMYEVCKAGYRIAAEVHDQLVVEVPRDSAEFDMKRIQKIMEEQMSKVCPDVKITTEGQIIERFTK